MAQCPKCGTELNSDFGMVACTKCGAISVIDLEGQVQLDAAPFPSEPLPLAPENEAAPAQDFFASGDFNFALDDSQPAPLSEPSEAVEESLSSIADFGNSEQSLARDGLYVFDVVISGIDTKEQREAVRASLDDDRFLWNVTSIMARVSSGVLEIRGLNPAKTSILVNRLKGLSLDVRWKQNAIIND